MDLGSKKIVVTGGSGFLGKFVCKELAARGLNITTKLDTNYQVLSLNSKQFDLTKSGEVSLMYTTLKPDVVIHLAAVVGGIGINRQKPGTFYYQNLMMGAQLIEYGRIMEIDKFVAIGTICAYPKNTPVPFKEENLWDGYPEETNAPYGIAKKAMLVQSQAYRDEFGFNSIYLLPVNLYGPHDNFDLNSSHVIPALIRKFSEAKKSGEQVTLWGTGRATREFLYVKDAAEAIVTATENYESGEPMNIGSGNEISIASLAELIKRLVGYDGEIDWDSSYPDGQPRRCLDVTRAMEMGFKAKTNLEDGLRQTIQWYQNEYHD